MDRKIAAEVFQGKKKVAKPGVTEPSFSSHLPLSISLSYRL